MTVDPVFTSNDMSASRLFRGLLSRVGYGSEPLLGDREIQRIVGDRARVGSALSRPHEIRVVSWNIARGTQFDDVLNVLAALDADVHALQEVDWMCRRSGDRRIASDLADALDMNWVFAGEFQEIGEGRGQRPALTGQCILSRYPISDASVLGFKSQANLRWRLDPFQPRRGGRIVLCARSCGVVIYNAHIESARSDRFRARQVNEMLADYVRLHGAAAPVILAGDLNTGPALRSPVVQSILSHGFADALGHANDSRKTAVRHPHPLDWIFVKHLTFRGGGVSHHQEASDHYPLQATIRVPRLDVLAP
jgi:endonuclease/exonuclease/phosphatase family metal-dependent hydrolase